MIRVGFNRKIYITYVFKLSVILVANFISMVSISVKALAYNDVDNGDYIVLYEDLDNNVKQYIDQMSEIYQIPRYYIYGIAYNESRFRYKATNYNINGTKDYGIMQVNSSCFDYLHKTIGLQSMYDLYDPYVCIDAAFALLNYHQCEVEDNNLMLLRYQVGEGRYDEILSNNHRLPNSFRSTYKAIDTYRQYFNWKAIMEYKDDILIY